MSFPSLEYKLPKFGTKPGCAEPLGIIGAIGAISKPFLLEFRPAVGLSQLSARFERNFGSIGNQTQQIV
jgi:hypothetical protein